MIDYTSEYQSKIREFCNLHQLKHNHNNRWIQLSFLLPWDEMVKRHTPLSSIKTAELRPLIPGSSSEHSSLRDKLGLSDEETLQTISENPHMQFFLGLQNYCPEQLFCPTLFVEMCKRLGDDAFAQFNELIMAMPCPIRI